VTARVSAGRVVAELEGEMPPLLTGEVGIPREQVTQLAKADTRRFAELLKNWIGEV
jgi:flagellar biosynthesis/type III secretory pathway M-ring protein FliF/YscJ